MERELPATFRPWDWWLESNPQVAREPRHFQNRSAQSWQMRGSLLPPLTLVSAPVLAERLWLRNTRPLSMSNCLTFFLKR